MLNNLSIRKKLALVALGPLLLLLVLAGLRIRGDLNDTSVANDDQATATVSALTGQLFDALRVESVENQNAVAIRGLDLGPVRADTDAAIDRWLASVGEFESLDDGALSSIVSDFNGHRAEIAAEFATETGASSVYQADSAVLEAVAAFDGLLAQSASQEALDLRQAADLSSVSLEAAKLQILGVWSANADQVPSELPSALGASKGAAESFGLRSGVELPVAEGSYEGLVEELTTLSPGDTVGISANDWREASDARAVQLSSLRAGEVAAASNAAVESQNDAQSAMRTAGLLSLVGIVVALAAAVFIGRGFTTALRTLREEAVSLADHDLPRLADALSTGQAIVPSGEERAVDSLGDNEFGAVAAGLVSIRENASVLGGKVTSLQSGIADTFVNLARRNQSLVDRQLEAIDTLEAEERDSDRLALMYRVDHLATRMRRNAESLLVLADAKTPERHSPAVEMREVLRVAIGEVEDYRRIIPVALDDLHVAGHRAQDFAHLLAELMENAAQHSPPGTAVDVAGAFESGSGDYLVTILDHGTGLDPVQMAELNALLAKPPASTLTISHSIGLHVVSRLAHSLGLLVTLDAREEAGLTATVRIPKAVVAEWGHTAPAAASIAQVARAVPTAPISPEAPATPVAEVFAPSPAPAEDPVVVPEPDPELATTPFPEVEPAPSPMPITSFEPVSMPEPPAVPVMDMPSLDLPSFGMAQDEAETASIVEPAPDPIPEAPTAIFDSASIPDAPAPIAEVAEVFSPVVESPQAFEPAPAPITEAPVFEPSPVAEAAPPVAPTPAPTPAPAPVPAPAPSPAPIAERTAPAASVTASGLVKRQRQATEIPQVDLTADRTAPSQRTPDQVRNMLSRYKTGLERGRGTAETDGEA